MAVPDDGSTLGQRRLPVLTGRAWTFTDNLSAADVLPLRFASLPAAQAARHLFADLDGDLASRLAPGDVLIAGQNVGGGAGAAAAARAHAAAGFVAVVAGSFVVGFAEAALEAGLVPLEVDAPATFHTGHQLRINLEGATISDLSSGDRQPVRNLSDQLLERLRTLLGR
jgi:3-isopropylmalate/(R)-2-methylmalate dehydratase small subunit